VGIVIDKQRLKPVGPDAPVQAKLLYQKGGGDLAGKIAEVSGLLEFAHRGIYEGHSRHAMTPPVLSVTTTTPRCSSGRTERSVQEEQVDAPTPGRVAKEVSPTHFVNEVLHVGT